MDIVRENIYQNQLFQVVGILLSLTVLQKFHYKILYYLKEYMGVIGEGLVDIFIRVSIIIHEFSHLIVVLLFGGKVQSISLFDKTGGSVDFSKSDYLDNLVYNDMSLWYILLLIFSRLGIFLISIAPLLVGILITWGLFNFGIGVNIFSDQVSINLFDFSILNILVLSIYSFVILPGFLLSFQDLSNLVWYHSTSWLVSIFGSFFNLLFFVGFIFIATFFLDILIYIFQFYFIVFCVLLCFCLLFRIYKLIASFA